LQARPSGARHRRCRRGIEARAPGAAGVPMEARAAVGTPVTRWIQVSSFTT